MVYPHVVQLNVFFPDAAAAATAAELTGVAAPPATTPPVVTGRRRKLQLKYHSLRAGLDTWFKNIAKYLLSAELDNILSSSVCSDPKDLTGCCVRCLSGLDLSLLSVELFSVLCQLVLRGCQVTTLGTLVNHLGRQSGTNSASCCCCCRCCPWLLAWLLGNCWLAG